MVAVPFARIRRQSHPVARGRMARLPGFVAQASGEPGAEIAGIRDHQIGFAPLDHDAPGM
jgi:hypothetical protein